MAYEFTITNTRIQSLDLCYRVPKTETAQSNRPIIWVHIPAKALNYKVALTDELHFKAFIEQNSQSIAAEDIIIGEKTSENKAMKINEKNAQEEVKNVRKKKNDSVKGFENAVNANSKASLKVNISKE